jgi:hypothetical protein
MALLIRRQGTAQVSVVPSGATSFLPPGLRIEIGIRTVTVRLSPVSLGSVITPLSGIPV